MLPQYDFSKAVRNPYTEKLKPQVSISVDADVFAYFQTVSDETGVPCQKLINLYLSDCAKHHKRLANVQI